MSTLVMTRDETKSIGGFSTAKRWAGLILTALPVLFLVFDSVVKFTTIPAVGDSFEQLGYPLRLAVGIGILELVCLALYVIPRTSPIGAVLLTGYLGGAVATHVRVGNPLATHVLFPIYVGTLIWAGLLLRDERIRKIVVSQRLSTLGR